MLFPSLADDKADATNIEEHTSSEEEFKFDDKYGLFKIFFSYLNNL